MLSWARTLVVFNMALLIFISERAAGQEEDFLWAQPLFKMMQKRNEFLFAADSNREKKDDYTYLKTFVQTLRDLPEITEKFLHAPYSIPEVKNDNFDMIINLKGWSWGQIFMLINSNTLSAVAEKRGIEILREIEKRIEGYLGSGDHSVPYRLPLEEICSNIPTNDLPKEMSIADICPNVNSCAAVEQPYGHDGRGERFEKSCTSDGKCDVEKALPMMAGIFWYKLTDFMAETLCPRNCQNGNCTVKENYDKVMHEAKLLMAYANILPSYFNSTWDTFFNDAVDNKAYLNVDVALSMVLEKEHVFDTTPTACNELMFTVACPYADIYKEYVLMRKIQQHRKQPGLVKDLRLMRKMDHQKMLELQRETVQHIELLGAINSLNENLESSVQGISRYFEGIAKYEEGIADADVAFIQGELDKYETSLADVEKKVKNDVHEAMKKMEVMLAANLGEQIAYLAALIAENSNPLKLIFSGPDLKDVLEQTGKVAEATAQLVKGTALILSLEGLAKDSLEIGKAFTGNKGQITSLKTVVTKIRKGQSNEIGAHADEFVREYGAYTPQTDRSALEKNNALWSAFKDATCDLLSGEVGFAGATAKGIVGGKLLCERLDGTLAQFFTLREDIFDFQFQLVDSVALVVRGNIAKRLSKNIKGKGDVLHANQLMIGFFMMQNKLQTSASVFCDIIEYKQLGKPSDDCSPANGIFRKENLDVLITFKDTTSFDEVERDVYIPTRAAFEGDTGFIDIQALARGEKVIFKLPADKDWLLDNRWILAGQTSVPFLMELELFLPHKEYKTGAGRQHTTTQVTIKSIASSSVSSILSNTAPVYILPREHSTYRTVYEEGYTSCSANEIDNPYSLCKNLPKICDVVTRKAEQSLLPTILSTWSLKIQIQQGAKILKWSAPTPATNLLLRAKVKLKIPSGQKKRHHIQLLFERSDVVVSEDGCCQENRYRVSLYNNNCEPCPKDSTSHLSGVYCEINEN